MGFSHIFKIMDTVSKDIFKRVAGFTVESTSASDMQAGDLWSLVTSTQGDYDMTVILCMDLKVMREIVRNMRHGAAFTDADIQIYVTEFYNILCGRIISDINQESHSRARFGIPHFIKGAYIAGNEPAPGDKQDFYYSCIYGTIKLELLFNSIMEYVE